MKKYFLIIVFHCIVVESFSQAGVGIGIAAPDVSAVLHVQPPTNNKGMLIPRLTTTQRNAIDPAAEGLLVYDTDVNALFHYNVTWQQVGVPAGTIVMWAGNVAPAGWALCDGVGGRPDLRERFIVGAGGENLTQPVVGTGYNVGDIAGLSTVTLTAAQMPSHTHVIDNGGLHTHDYQAPLTNGSHPGGSNGYDRPNAREAGNTGDTGSAHSHTMQAAGSSQAHENRPPYYALAFIIKL